MIGSLARRMRALPLRWGFALAAAAQLSCNAGPLVAPKPAPETQVNRVIELNQIRDVDIVFMIDNSSSMFDEQENLGRNFPRFVDALNKIQGGLPNVRIAVITSDMGTPGVEGVCSVGYGDGGKFQFNKRDRDGNFVERCLPEGVTYIEATSSGNNLGGKTLTSAFTCMAQQGSRGCGYEHQLQALRVGLYDKQSSVGENGVAAFLRKDAYLALIIISDEDDCSVSPEFSTKFFGAKNEFGDDSAVEAASFRCAKKGNICSGEKPGDAKKSWENVAAQCRPNDDSPLIPVQSFVDDIAQLKGGDVSKIFVSGVIGWPKAGEMGRYSVDQFPDPSDGGKLKWDLGPICERGAGANLSKAYAGLRLRQFIGSFGENGIESICAESFDNALKSIGDALAKRIDNSCINTALYDREPNKNGIQPECAVEETIGTAKPTVIPACDVNGGARPCWELATDTGCPIVRVLRVNDDPAPQGARVSVRCKGA